MPEADASDADIYTLGVTWFVPNRAGPSCGVKTLEEFHSLTGPYRDVERLVVELDRAGGELGCVWVHFTGERAWVTHWETVGGSDLYCRATDGFTSPDSVGFLLTNGQLDRIHPGWTVPRADGWRALEYFLGHGDVHPGLERATPEQSFGDPP